MPRRKSLVTIIRELLQEEVRKSMAGLFGAFCAYEPDPVRSVAWQL